jgi:hypothetical protein
MSLSSAIEFNGIEGPISKFLSNDYLLPVWNLQLSIDYVKRQFTEPSETESLSLT